MFAMSKQYMLQLQGLRALRSLTWLWQQELTIASMHIFYLQLLTVGTPLLSYIVVDPSIFHVTWTHCGYCTRVMPCLAARAIPAMTAAAATPCARISDGVS